MRKITVTEYNKVIATFETFDNLKDWLKTDWSSVKISDKKFE